MDQEYRLAKESFAVNQNAASSPVEIISLCLMNHWSFLLLNVMLSIFPLLYKARSFSRILMESMVLFVPVIIGLTVFSFLPIIFPALILVSAIILMITYSRAITSCQWTEVLLIPKPGPKPTRLPALDGAHRNLLIMTVVSILAVDFPSFPRSFCKTTTHGFSLMDVGVGSFIMLNGMLSPEARSPTLRGNYLLGKSMTSCIPIILLGFIRLVLVSGVNYQEIVTEYGTHWNFFFTLAFVKIIGTLAHNRLSGIVSPVKFVAIIIAVYQMILCTGLKNLILNDDRSNFLLANKEGIFTIPAYVCLYLTSVSVGSYMHSRRRSGKAIDHLLMAIENGLIFAISGIMCILTHTYVDQVSRRTANLTFVLWIICLSSFSVVVESLILLVIEFLQATGFLRCQLESQPISSSCICNNSLFVFLLANIFTGIVNLTMDTMHASIWTTIATLVTYTSLLSLAAHVISMKKVKLKVPDYLSSRLSAILSK